MLTVQALAKVSAIVFMLLLVADWWARTHDWDLRQRLTELKILALQWDEPLSKRLVRMRSRSSLQHLRRERALLALGVASKASHTVRLHRHFTLGPPQVVLTYGRHCVKVRLYNHTVWRLNRFYEVKLLSLEPDGDVGWRFAVYSPEAGRVAQFAWLVTAG